MATVMPLDSVRDDATRQKFGFATIAKCYIDAPSRSRSFTLTTTPYEINMISEFVGKRLRSRTKQRCLDTLHLDIKLVVSTSFKHLNGGSGAMKSMIRVDDATRM